MGRIFFPYNNLIKMECQLTIIDPDTSLCMSIPYRKSNASKIPPSATIKYIGSIYLTKGRFLLLDGDHLVQLYYEERYIERSYTPY